MKTATFLSAAALVATASASPQFFSSSPESATTVTSTEIVPLIPTVTSIPTLTFPTTIGYPTYPADTTSTPPSAPYPLSSTPGAPYPTGGYPTGGYPTGGYPTGGSCPTYYGTGGIYPSGCSPPHHTSPSPTTSAPSGATSLPFFNAAPAPGVNAKGVAGSIAVAMAAILAL